jgi:chemotaxis protein MotB
MIRIASLLLFPLLLVAACAPPSQQRSLEFRIERLENERDTCQTALRDERARADALQTRLAEKSRELSAAQAEVHLYRERVAQLETERDQLRDVVTAGAQQPLARPEVKVSPLPEPLDEALRAFADRFQQRVDYAIGRGAITFSSDALFESGSDQLQSVAFAALDALAKVLEQHMPTDHEVVVVGHTDDAAITRPETLAKHPSNWHLSVHRAIAVKNVLTKAGLSAERVGVMGYGPNRPRSSNRALNRRVEVFIIRRGDVQNFAPVR